jgi:hypothetical protein
MKKNLKILSAQNKMDEHRQNWLNHMHRMTDERIKKKHILQCKDGINMSEQTELPVP